MATLKYAHVERERRWLLAAVPDLPEHARRLDIVDRYVNGTRLRLREVTEAGVVTRKLGQKVRLGKGAAEVAHTSVVHLDLEGHGRELFSDSTTVYLLPSSMQSCAVSNTNIELPSKIVA